MTKLSHQSDGSQQRTFQNEWQGKTAFFKS